MTLANIPNITVYTYTTSSVAYTFVRQMNEGDQEWFRSKTVYAKEPILDRATGEVSIDLGGFLYDSLTIRAEFDSDSARTTFKNLNGTSGTLANTRSRSASGVVLIDTSYVYQSGKYVLECVFEKYA